MVKKKQAATDKATTAKMDKVLLRMLKTPPKPRSKGSKKAAKSK